MTEAREAWKQVRREFREAPVRSALFVALFCLEMAGMYVVLYCLALWLERVV